MELKTIHTPACDRFLFAWSINARSDPRASCLPTLPSTERENERRDCDSLFEWRPNSNRKGESYPICFHPGPIAFRPQSHNSEWTFDARRGIPESLESEELRALQALEVAGVEMQLKLAVHGVAQSAPKAVALDRKDPLRSASPAPDCTSGLGNLVMCSRVSRKDMVNRTVNKTASKTPQRKVANRKTAALDAQRLEENERSEPQE